MPESNQKQRGSHAVLAIVSMEFRQPSQLYGSRGAPFVPGELPGAVAGSLEGEDHAILTGKDAPKEPIATKAPSRTSDRELT